MKHWEDLQTLFMNSDRILVENDLRSSINSPIGERTTWVLVEGTCDPWFYDRMFTGSLVKVVKVGIKDKLGNPKGGYKAVEKIVHKLQKDATSLVFGIIDKDYTQFNKQRHIDSSCIFTTDHRDIEMTLLSNDDAREKLQTEILSNAKPSQFGKMKPKDWFSKQWNLCEIVCRFLGELRIAGTWLNIPTGLNFKPSLFWNAKDKALVKGWKQHIYISAFKQCLHKRYLFMSPILHLCSNYRHRTKVMKIWDVCRGHDFMGFLSELMVDKYHFSPAWMTYFLAKEVSLSDIRKMQLYKTIHTWQSAHSVNVLV